MLILIIRTDNPEAEVGLFNNDEKLEYSTWHAHRELSVTLHKKVEEILKLQGRTLQDLEGVICFKGPGSFTGLRIGLTVANALAYGLKIPIIGIEGDNWIANGIAKLQAGDNDTITLPHYGSKPHITLPKK